MTVTGNLLGIIGSPRRMGNCELMVKEIAAAIPGDAIVFEEGRNAAHRLAAALDSPDDYNPDGVSCPECKGTYFEFRGTDAVYCLSCGSTGTLSVSFARGNG